MANVVKFQIEVFIISRLCDTQHFSSSRHEDNFDWLKIPYRSDTCHMCPSWRCPSYDAVNEYSFRGFSDPWSAKRNLSRLPLRIVVLFDIDESQDEIDWLSHSS